MERTKADWLERLEPHGQTHLLAFWNELNAAERERLTQQIEAIDFAELAGLVHGHDEAPDWPALAARATSPPAFRLHDEQPRFSADEAREAGETALRAGRVGMILVAGGQGTRLGFEHPKSMFAIGPVSGASLLQILTERLRAISRRYGAAIPMYMMTSPATHAETVAFTDEFARFGLPAEDFRLFCQGTMPAVDLEGRVLLAKRDSLAIAPNGHGGMVEALGRSRCLADAQSRGIDILFYGQVDNPLLQVCDPTLIGYHLLARSEMTTQVVEKRYPLERVGNVVEIDGRVQIIEYSDLPNEAAELRDETGRLKLWAGNLAVHVFDVPFLERVIEHPESLPFHRARKKTPFLAADGTRVEPNEPNSIKFERFIFDLLPAANHAIVVEVDPAEAFAPVKNANDAETDTPRIAQAMMVALHRRWLREAGAEAPNDVPVEISPLWALDAEDCRRRGVAGTKFDEPTYLHE
ncbi:MAG: UDPGP type 1 family protein [Planctomycetales bacterium]|nr:UDPGP type 1 family protein [Planctomycetales bacterium]